MSEVPSNQIEEFEDPLSNYEPKVYDSPLSEALTEKTVAAIEATPFAVIPVDAPVRQAVHALHGLKVSSLLVVESDKLIGIFTERDVLEKVAENYAALADAPVRDVMTANPIVVYVNNQSGAALSAIAVSGYRHVPVLDMDDLVVGIVSPRRVFSFLERYFQPTV